MNEPEDGLVVTLLKAAAAIAPVLIMIYAAEPTVRWAVDQWLERARYRVRVESWRRRVWDRFAPYEQEHWEQVHGPLEA